MFEIYCNGIVELVTQGVDKWQRPTGDKTYRALPARIDRKQRLIRDGQGELVQSQARITLLEAVSPGAVLRVDGQELVILQTESRSSFTETHWEAYV